MVFLVLYGLCKARMVLCVKCTVAVFFFPRRTVFDTTTEGTHSSAPEVGLDNQFVNFVTRCIYWLLCNNLRTMLLRNVAAAVMQSTHCLFLCTFQGEKRLSTGRKTKTRGHQFSLFNNVSLKSTKVILKNSLLRFWSVVYFTVSSKLTFVLCAVHRLCSSTRITREFVFYLSVHVHAYELYQGTKFFCLFYNLAVIMFFRKSLLFVEKINRILMLICNVHFRL